MVDLLGGAQYRSRGRRRAPYTPTNPGEGPCTHGSVGGRSAALTALLCTDTSIRRSRGSGPCRYRSPQSPLGTWGLLVVELVNPIRPTRYRARSSRPSAGSTSAPVAVTLRYVGAVEAGRADTVAPSHRWGLGAFWSSSWYCGPIGTLGGRSLRDARPERCLSFPPCRYTRVRDCRFIGHEVPTQHAHRRWRNWPNIDPAGPSEHLGGGASATRVRSVVFPFHLADTRACGNRLLQW